MNKMNFLEHCIELRKRIFLFLIFLASSFAISYFYAQELYEFLLKPLQQIDLNSDRKLIYTALPEAFLSYMRLSFFIALMVTLPYINWHMYKFTAPALYDSEKKFFATLCFFSPILFYFGCFFAYYLVFPMAWKFFLGFESHANTLPIVLEAKISEYLTFSMRVIVAFGFTFQLPIFMILFLKSGLISRASMAAKRKYAFLLFFVIGAIITPPDIISQIAIALPMYLLYEITLLLAKRLETNA